MLVFDRHIAICVDAGQIPLADFGEQDLRVYLRYGKADYLVTKVTSWKKLYPFIAENPELHGLIIERQFGAHEKSRLIVFKIKQREGGDSAG